ncbi:MAG TPA: IS110 family transposase [Verrucomicrobiae bacterium]|nr:IS110 family transposase [Verrucomicrobiae bacterium]
MKFETRTSPGWIVPPAGNPGGTKATPYGFKSPLAGTVDTTRTGPGRNGLSSAFNRAGQSTPSKTAAVNGINKRLNFKQQLHKAGYFRELLATNPDIDEGLCSLLRLCRETVVRLQKTESALVRSLERDALLVERVERLMSIPAVGPITALTWALEVGDVQCFSSIKKAISYCGLCGAEKSSGTTVQRTPLSKQRNKHLQTTLIEAAKMAPRNSPELAMLYDREKQKGNANRATLAVARKLVAYLVAVDRRQKEFLVVEKENCAAA